MINQRQLLHLLYISGNIANDESKAIKETGVTPNEDTREAEDNQCPLCQDYFTSKEALVQHAVSFHSINEEGLVSLHNWIKSKSARKRYELPTDEIRYGNEHPAPLSKGRKGS